MFQALHNANAAGGFGGDAISTIDIALWDIAGKAAGKSIAELLGGRLRDKVAVYATGLYYRKDEFPTKLLDEASAYVEAGFKGMKTKVGGLSLREDVARVGALRGAIGDDIYLMVDANKAYDVSTAIEMGRHLADLDIHWFEEPLMAHDTNGYLEVKHGQPIRVAGGEIFRNRFEFHDIITRNAVDIVQPDISLAGGITEFRNIASLANTCGVQVNPHVWGSSVMISATLNLVSTFAPNPYAHTVYPYEQEPVMEFDQTPNPIRDDLCSICFKQEDGFVVTPEGPGLGVEIDESVLNKFCDARVVTE
jgi:D-galactarolactone cycloisomerase